jgi:hypothetical protein
VAFSFLIPQELKARHKRRGVTRALLVKLFLKPTGLTEAEKAYYPGFSTSNKVCCRSELSFSTGGLNLSTVFLATD